MEHDRAIGKIIDTGGKVTHEQPDGPDGRKKNNSNIVGDSGGFSWSFIKSDLSEVYKVIQLVGDWKFGPHAPSKRSVLDKPSSAISRSGSNEDTLSPLASGKLSDVMSSYTSHNLLNVPSALNVVSRLDAVIDNVLSRRSVVFPNILGLYSTNSAVQVALHDVARGNESENGSSSIVQRGNGYGRTMELAHLVDSGLPKPVAPIHKKAVDSERYGATPMQQSISGDMVEGRSQIEIPWSTPSSSHFDLSRVLDDYFLRQTRLPPSGATGFDPRLTPVWAGLKLPV